MQLYECWGGIHVRVVGAFGDSGCLCWCHQIFLSLSCLPGLVVVLRNLLTVGVICPRAKERFITPFLVPHLLSEMHRICIAALGHFETLVYCLKEIWVLCCDGYKMEGERGWLCKFALYFCLKKSLFHILKPVWMLFTYPKVKSIHGLSWCDNCVFTILWIARIYLFGE